MFLEDEQWPHKESNHRAPSVFSSFCGVESSLSFTPADLTKGQGFPRRPIPWSRAVYFTSGKAPAPEHHERAHVVVCALERVVSSISSCSSRDLYRKTAVIQKRLGFYWILLEARGRRKRKSSYSRDGFYLQWDIQQPWHGNLLWVSDRLLSSVSVGELGCFRLYRGRMSGFH